MRETPFGTIYMAFYSEKFRGDKSLKSNISVLKIINQYDRDSKSFQIGGKRIHLTVEDVVLTFGLPINRADFIMNKTRTLKDRGVIKHNFQRLRKSQKYPLKRF